MSYRVKYRPSTKRVVRLTFGTIRRVGKIPKKETEKEDRTYLNRMFRAATQSSSSSSTPLPHHSCGHSGNGARLRHVIGQLSDVKQYVADVDDPRKLKFGEFWDIEVLVFCPNFLDFGSAECKSNDACAENIFKGSDILQYASLLNKTTSEKRGKEKK